MNTGERGESGDRGVQGERGERGAHGQHGEKGDIGKTGAAGPAGATSPYLSRSRTLALFAFVVLAFLLLAARSEINASHIREGVYEACIQRADIDRVRSDCERFR